MTKPLLLVLCPLSEQHRTQISLYYSVIYKPDTRGAHDQIAVSHGDVQVVLTTGVNGLTEGAIDAMPRLELICTIGVGHENVASDYARARGIVLANGRGTNAECVADHAMGLLLATVRQLVFMDGQLRKGFWREQLPMPAHVSGRRLGLVGMGDIARRIAKRAAAFNLDIAYCTRTVRDDVSYPHYQHVVELAGQVDYLVVVVPGGEQTFHLIGRDELNALGSDGYLINVSRGSVVDTDALATALRSGKIAGAGLDVYESEPEPPEQLIGLSNVVLTPHIGGTSPVAVQRSVDQFLQNAAGHFAGDGPVSPF